MSKQTNRLTPRQEAFCQAYAVQKNAKQAAMDAGYSPRTAQVQGSHMLSNDKIRSRVEVLLRRKDECAQITADYVLMRAVEVYERCMGAVPVVKRGEQEVDAVGNAVYTFDVKGALSALELIGKHVAVAAFKEKSADKGAEKNTDLKEDAPAGQLDLPIELSESERAARIGKILAMAQARKAHAQQGQEKPTANQQHGGA